MKRITLLALSFIVSIAAFAQTIEKQPIVKKIEVTGSAEMEITPDEITVMITLREYMNRNNKVGISKLEEKLQKAVERAGIAPEQLTIANVFGYNYETWWKKKKNDQDFLARKQYALKVNRLDKINGILAAVDEEGIESVNIGQYDHSKMQEFRKQVKMDALKAAKEKAQYLLGAIDEQLGGVIEVVEYNNDGYADATPRVFAVANMAKSAAMQESIPDSNLDVKTIKIRAEIRAVFSIK